MRNAGLRKKSPPNPPPKKNRSFFRSLAWTPSSKLDLPASLLSQVGGPSFFPDGFLVTNKTPEIDKWVLSWVRVFFAKNKAEICSEKDVHFVTVCFFFFLGGGVGIFWVKRMLRKFVFFFWFPILVAVCLLLIWDFFLWNSVGILHRCWRSSTVFPLRSERGWNIGTCRHELQVARGAWEMLQGKPWASWGPNNFSLPFFVGKIWKNCFIFVQPKNPKHKRLKECKHG